MKPHLALTFLLLPALSNPSAASPEALGRLFFTPQQRAALDQQRWQNNAFVPGEADEAPSQTRNGEVRRSDGRNSQWINGQVNFVAPEKPPPVPVGDTFYPGSGEHKSLLNDGQITLKPARQKK